jgi:hypothetical protein
MRVKVRDNFRDLAEGDLEHPGISAGVEFYVLEINDEYFRIVDKHGEPILYPKPLFEVLDCSIPSNWEFREYKDGEYFLQPLRIGERGFYEHWHGSDDRAAQEKARRRFRDELSRSAATASPEDKELVEDALLRLRDNLTSCDSGDGAKQSALDH